MCCICLFVVVVISLLSCMLLLFFFFFKQKTAYEMRISDWSSDVCSSDLADASRNAVGGCLLAQSRGGSRCDGVPSRHRQAWQGDVMAFRAGTCPAAREHRL